MINKNIYILSAPKHSGKTTRLIEWATDRNDVFGIVTPIVDGKRVFRDIASGEQFQMEADEDETAVLEVGKYRFSQAAFEKASAIISDAMKIKEGWIVIDEIGPLELKKQGFYEASKKVLQKQHCSVNLFFVIREELVDDILSFFDINHKDIIYWSLLKNTTC